MKRRSFLKWDFNRTKIRLLKKVIKYCCAVTTFGVFMVFLRDWSAWNSTSAVVTETGRTDSTVSMELLHNIVVSPRQSTGELHKTTLITRRTCVHSHYFLLILVASAPAHIIRRKLIRQTWGADTVIVPRWKTVFLIGQTTDQTYSRVLLAEDRIYGDIIRADYYENYWNQTLKIEMGFEWAAKYCNFSFLLKADDDVFINPPALISVLKKESTPKKKLYMGFVFKSPIVGRSGKWKVSREEYNGTFYPDYCAGPGFVLSLDVVNLFVDVFGLLPKFRIDDVYVGMLANITDVEAVHEKGFQTPYPLSTTCVLHADTLVRHGATGICLVELFHLAANNRTGKPRTS